MKKIIVYFFFFIATVLISCNREPTHEYRLFEACVNGDVSMVSLLLSQGISANSQLSRRENKIFNETYNDIIISAFPNDPDYNVYFDIKLTICSPLFISSITGSLELMKILIMNDADVNYQDPKSLLTPLACSISKGYIELSKYLIEYGANINITYMWGLNCLQIAVLNNDFRSTKLLIDFGIKLSNAYTEPLKIAVTNDNIEIVKLLLENGADINDASILDKYYKGETILMVAVRRKNIDMINTILMANPSLDVVATDYSKKTTYTVLDILNEINDKQITDVFDEFLNPDILEYFPTKIGYMWEYIGNNGEITDRIQCEQTIDDGALFYTYTLLGMRIGDLYIFESNSVQEIVSINAFGRQQFYRPALTIVTVPGKQWEEEDRGDVFQCHSKKTSVSFDGKTYNDCIMVEKVIILGDGRYLMTKRQYFAHGIGLVYETLQGVDDTEEKPFLRLSSHNF